MFHWYHVSQSLAVSSLLLFSWQRSTLAQEGTDELNATHHEKIKADLISPDSQVTITPTAFAYQNAIPNDEAAGAELILASKQKSSETCSIKTSQAKAEEYNIPLAIAVRNRPVSIAVEGNTILAEEIKTEVERSFPPQTERELSIRQFQQKLKKTARKITKLYSERGYLTSQAKVGRLAIADGNLVGKINIIEGRLNQIEIEGRKRLDLSYICSRLERGIDTPLNFNQLEDRLRLLRVNPLLEDLNATIGETGKRGESNLVVEVTEANPLFASLGVDNYSPPSVGSVRLGSTLGYLNVTGLGDIFTTTYYRTTTGGSDNLDLAYQVPLNSLDGSLSLRFAPEWREVTQSPFDELDIEGEKELYEISYRQPLIRTSGEEFALSLGFNYQDDETTLLERPFSFTTGPIDGESRTRTIQFAQEYINRDRDGAWSLRSQFNFGVDIFDATDNDSSAPDGSFFSWLFQTQRLQVLGRDNLLVIQANLQLTPDALLPNQQFTIGGGQSVRGYRQNARFGDNGLRFSIEDRITLERHEVEDPRDTQGEPSFQLAPFVDLGYVWNQEDNPNELPDDQFLIGAGLGLLLEPVENWQIRLDYGYPFIDIEGRGDDIQDDGFYFSTSYSF